MAVNLKRIVQNFNCNSISAYLFLYSVILRKKDYAMSFLKIIFIALFMFLLAGFAYFAVTDIPIKQTDVTIEIQPTKATAQ